MFFESPRFEKFLFLLQINLADLALLNPADYNPDRLILVVAVRDVIKEETV